MHTKAALYAALALIVAIGVVWLAMSYSATALPFSAQTATSTSATNTTSTTHSISWKFTDLGEDAQSMPHTNVVVLIDGKSYDTGTHSGTCSEIGGEGRTELLTGEIAGAECWFAGGGDEIGVFLENEQLVVKQGELDEGGYNIPGTRGNFKTIVTVGAAH